MKQAWCPETATKAYIDTVKSFKLFQEFSVAEFVSAMAAGRKAKLIVETWSQGGVVTTSLGLAIASHHTGGRHVCIVPNEISRSEYVNAMRESGMLPEVIVGEAEDMMQQLVGIDFLVVDSRWKDFSRVLRLARLSNQGAVLICKNASLRSVSSFRWSSALAEGSRPIVQSVFLPVGKGLDIAHVASSPGGGSSGPMNNGSKWIKYVDRVSGEEYFIRKKLHRRHGSS